ncbi:MAG: hypothetical protein IPL22_15710 [Bacteroidetes bacterium]|nr:hypothetical protein [Bacteroidota bacterium]
MTKKLMFLIAGFMLATTLSNAQAIVGRIDNDGVTHMTVEKGHAKEVPKKCCHTKRRAATQSCRNYLHNNAAGTSLFDRL